MVLKSPILITVTLLGRLQIVPDVFIQVYANTRKEKLNLALIISGNRIYGVDREGGFYHEHPVENPESHKISKPVGVEEFLIKCLELLERMGFI
jgi:hypothetical protein